MPADDLVLNVRQIAGYPPAASTSSADDVLIQQGGLGGPYASISSNLFVSTALATAGGPMSIGANAPSDSVGDALFTDNYTMTFDGQLLWNAYSSRADPAFPYPISPGQPAGAFDFDPVSGFSFWFAATSVAASPIAWIKPLIIDPTGYLTVRNQVLLSRDPVAPLEAATAQYVAAQLAGTVSSFNGRTGAVWLAIEDILGAGGAPVWSPVFGGSPCAPTPEPSSASSRLATTAFVHGAIVAYINEFLAGNPSVTSFNGRMGAVTLTANDVVAANPPYAPLASPVFSGTPSAPTAVAGSANGQLATTAFVMSAVADSVAGVVSFNGRTGLVVLQTADITGAGGAPLASPAFSGTPSAPTPPAADNSTRLATTAFVLSSVGAGYAPLNSPAFTGVPTAPTAAQGTNTGQIATTGFVLNEITAVDAGVVSFNGRTGVVSLLANDISAAGGAILASPAFIGLPSAPTANPGTNTTQLATTQFVTAAIAAVPAPPAASTASPLMNGTAAAGVATAWSRGDHVHPSDTSRLALTGGALSGALTVNAAATFGPTGRQSTFDTHGTLSVGATASLPTNAVAGHIITGAGVVFGSAAVGVSVATNVYGDGAIWRYAAAGAAAVFTLFPPSNTLQILCFPAGVAGAPTGASSGTYIFSMTGDLAISGTFSQASDARGKRDVATATDGLDQVRRLTPKRYHRVHAPGSDAIDREELGFLAQDVREVLPVAVREDDKDRLSVALMPLIAMLTNAVKELDARLAALEPKGAMS